MRGRLLLIAFACLLPTALSARSEFVWTVEKVEVHQTETDSISVDIFVNVVKEKLRKKTAMVLQGFLLVGQEKIPLKAASFYTFDTQGKKYNVRKGYATASGYSDEMFFATGNCEGKFTMHSSIPIPPGINSCAVLMMQTERSAPDKQHVRIAMEVARFYYKPRPAVNPDIYYLPAPDDRGESHSDNYEMYLAFAEGNNTFDSQAGMNQKEIFDFVQGVSSVVSDKRTKMMSVSFNGYTGIEGPESTNIKVCRERTQSVFEYLNDKKIFGGEKVNVNYKGEDWKTVNEWIDDSFWGRDQEYHNLIRRAQNNDSRERALKEQYPELWETLSSRLFPDLERYECVLVYTVDPFEDDDAILRAYNVNSRLLCQHDFYRLLNTQDMYSQMWFEILDDWVERYPYSKPALVNASAAYLACGKLREANSFLRLLGDSDDARYYKALWFFYSGNLDSAFELVSSLDLRNPAFGSFFEQMKEYRNWKFNSFTRTMEE